MGTTRIGAVSALLVAGLFCASPAVANQQDVQIFRGGKAGNIVETREAGVQVFRGTPIAVERATAKALPRRAIVAAGSRIWFVDHAAEKLTICRSVATTQVGERRIDCQSRVLPR